MTKNALFAFGTAVALFAGSSSAMAAGDPAAGEQVFKKNCTSCHSTEAGKHMTGPSLHGVYGRKAGASDFPRYKGVKDADFVWDDEKLNEYLQDPKAFVTKNTKNTTTAMTFKMPGDAKEKDREDVIAYLKTLK